MPLTRRTQSVAVPPAELARLRGQLAPYGSLLWDPEGERLLVLRVPGAEPDVVNDIEEASEYVGAELAEARMIVLLGDRASTLVPPDVLRSLVQERHQRDREFARILRSAMKPGEHRIMPIPGDARRLPRLVLRLGRPQVQDADDNHWDAWAKVVGPELEGTMAGIRFVHMVADGDDVRLDADLVFHDLARRWSDEEERLRLASEAAEKMRPKTAAPTVAPPVTPGAGSLNGVPPRGSSLSSATYGAVPQGVTDAVEALTAKRIRLPDEINVPQFETDPRHQAIQRAVDQTVGAPVGAWTGLKPVERSASASSLDRLSRFDALASDSRSITDARGTAPARSAVDDILASAERRTPARAPRTSASSRPGLEGLDDILAGRGAVRSGTSSGVRSSASAPVAPPAPITYGPGVKELKDRLERAGYAIKDNPGMDQVVLAASRSRHPERVLVYAPARFDLAIAKHVLQAAKTLDVDLALIVCPEADQDAKERIIATRAKWVSPDAVADLILA